MALYLKYCRKNWEFTTSQYCDYLEYRRAYYGEAGTTFTIDALTLGMNAGWASPKFNQAYSNLTRGTLSNLALSGSYTIGLTETVTIQSHIEIFRNIDRELQRINGCNLLNFGVIFSIGA